MAGVGFVPLGFPDLDDPDYRCWFPMTFSTSGGREPVLGVEFASAYLLFAAVRTVSYEYDITVNDGATNDHFAGSGSLPPARIDAVTAPPSEQWLAFCTLLSCIILDVNFSVAGWTPSVYDPVTKQFSGTIFLEHGSAGFLISTSSQPPLIPTAIVGDMFGNPFNVYCNPGSTATGFFTMEIAEYWEYQLADGTICRDAITGELKQDTPPPGL